VRLIFAWGGLALFYIGGFLVVLVGAWSFGRVARREVRVPVVQGLIALACAIGAFGMGLAVVSLDSPSLVPLGLGIIGLSLLIGTYGARLLLKRS